MVPGLCCYFMFMRLINLVARIGSEMVELTGQKKYFLVLSHAWSWKSTGLSLI